MSSIEIKSVGSNLCSGTNLTYFASFKLTNLFLKMTLFHGGMNRFFSHCVRHEGQFPHREVLQPDVRQQEKLESFKFKALKIKECMEKPQDPHHLDIISPLSPCDKPPGHPSIL
jgi:hypothetical protein